MHVLTPLDPSGEDQQVFLMEAVEIDGRLLKKVAPSQAQPITSKPCSPDWTRDVWLLIFASPLFAFDFRSTAFRFYAFRSCSSLLGPTSYILPKPRSRFFHPPTFQATTPLLNFFISLPALPFPHSISAPSPGHHHSPTLPPIITWNSHPPLFRF